MSTLPTFKSYTVDYRLKEFRRMIYGEMPLFIPFNSPAGRSLLLEMEGEKESKPLDR